MNSVKELLWQFIGSIKHLTHLLGNKKPSYPRCFYNLSNPCSRHLWRATSKLWFYCDLWLSFSQQTFFFSALV